MTSFCLSVCKYSRSYRCIFHYCVTFCRNCYGSRCITGSAILNLASRCCTCSFFYNILGNPAVTMYFICGIKFISFRINLIPGSCLQIFLKCLKKNPCSIFRLSGHGRNIPAFCVLYAPVIRLTLHRNFQRLRISHTIPFSVFASDSFFISIQCNAFLCIINCFANLRVEVISDCIFKSIRSQHWCIITMVSVISIIPVISVIISWQLIQIVRTSRNLIPLSI